MKNILLSVACISIFSVAFAADPPKKAQLKLLGVFDAGQPGASIVKLFDQSDDVVCYVLIPDVMTRKQVEKDKFAYEGNSVGSISCLKVKLPVIPLNSQSAK
jgi:hypothetical protein